MAFIVGIIAVIVGVITKIITTIMSIVGFLISLISKTIAFIVGKITTLITSISKWLIPFISNITSFISKLINWVSAGVGYVIKFVWDALGKIIISQVVDILRLIINPISQLINLLFGPIQGLLAPIYEVIYTIKHVIRAILNPLLDIINPILDVIRFLYRQLAIPFLEIVNKLREIYLILRGNIIAIIANEIKDLADLLSFLHLLALSYTDIADGKVFKAIYRLMLYFDEKLATDLKNMTEALDSEIRAVYNELMKLIGFVQSDVLDLQEYSYNLGTVLFDIGKAFGIKSLADLGKELKDFSEGWLGDINNALDKVRAWGRKVYSTLTYPSIVAYEMMETTMREWHRYKRIYETLTLRSLLEREYPKYTMGFLVVGFPRW